jgi:hypothetical protein
MSVRGNGCYIHCKCIVERWVTGCEADMGREEARCTTSVRPEHLRVCRLLSGATAVFDAICDFLSLRQMRVTSADQRLFRRTYPTPLRSWAWEGFSHASIYVDTVHGEQEDQASEERITSEWLVSEVP